MRRGVRWAALRREWLQEPLATNQGHGRTNVGGGAWVRVRSFSKHLAWRRRRRVFRLKAMRAMASGALRHGGRRAAKGRRRAGRRRRWRTKVSGPAPPRMEPVAPLLPPGCALANAARTASGWLCAHLGVAQRRFDDASGSGKQRFGTRRASGDSASGPGNDGARLISKDT